MHVLDTEHLHQWMKCLHVARTLQCFQPCSLAGKPGGQETRSLVFQRRRKAAGGLRQKFTLITLPFSLPQPQHYTHAWNISLPLQHANALSLLHYNNTHPTTKIYRAKIYSVKIYPVKIPITLAILGTCVRFPFTTTKCLVLLLFPQLPQHWVWYPTIYHSLYTASVPNNAIKILTLLQSLPQTYIMVKISLKSYTAVRKRVFIRCYITQSLCFWYLPQIL